MQKGFGHMVPQQQWRVRTRNLTHAHAHTHTHTHKNTYTHTHTHTHSAHLHGRGRVEGRHRVTSTAVLWCEQRGWYMKRGHRTTEGMDGGREQEIKRMREEERVLMHLTCKLSARMWARILPESRCEGLRYTGTKNQRKGKRQKRF
jgi:hypothetical protein